MGDATQSVLFALIGFAGVWLLLPATTLLRVTAANHTGCHPAALPLPQDAVVDGKREQPRYWGGQHSLPRAAYHARCAGKDGRGGAECPARAAGGLGCVLLLLCCPCGTFLQGLSAGPYSAVQCVAHLCMPGLPCCPANPRAHPASASPRCLMQAVVLRAKCLDLGTAAELAVATSS